MVHAISFEEMLAELGLRSEMTHHLLLGSVRMKAEYLGLGFKGGVGSEWRDWQRAPRLSFAPAAMFTHSRAKLVGKPVGQRADCPVTR
jgi:predicted alpha/beta hydrolase